MKKLIRLLLLAVIATALVVGVSAQDNERILRMAMTVEPDMLINYFSNTDIAIRLNRLHSLPPWGMTAEGELVPLLIEELPTFENGGLSESDTGGTVVKFTIADWAVWSDGTPMSADDFVLPYDILNDGVSGLLDYNLPAGTIEQGESDKEVIVTYADPTPDWHLDEIMPLPAHALRAEYETALAEGNGFDTSDYLRAPTISNGPFVFEEWVTGSYIRFVRNDNFWKDVWFDEVVLEFFADATVIEQLMAAGEVDYTVYILPAARAAEFAEENDNVEVKPVFLSFRLELKLNLGPNGHPALKDVNVRRAIGMAIDRQFMVDEIYNGLSDVTNSLWDDTIWYNEDMPVLEYDPDAAVELLREAGWFDEDGDGVAEAHGVEGVEDGTPLELTASTYSGITHYEDSLLYLQDALSEIGIEFDINLYEVAVMHGSLTADSPYATGRHDLYLQAWIPGLSTINMFNPYWCDQIPTEENPSGWNGVHVCDEQMDELWAQLGTTFDDAERQALADEIQVIMGENLYTLYLVNLVSAITYNSSLEFEDNSASDITPFLGIENWSRTE